MLLVFLMILYTDKCKKKIQDEKQYIIKWNWTMYMVQDLNRLAQKGFVRRL